MARVDEAPEDRDVKPLQLTCNFDCEICDCTFDHVFVCPDGVFEMEDLVDAPKDVVACPNCGDSQEREYSGWLSHEDAG